MFGLNPIIGAGTCLGWSFLKVLFESLFGSAESWGWQMDSWGLFKDCGQRCTLRGGSTEWPDTMQPRRITGIRPQCCLFECKVFLQDNANGILYLTLSQVKLKMKNLKDLKGSFRSKGSDLTDCSSCFPHKCCKRIHDISPTDSDRCFHFLTQRYVLLSRNPSLC